MKFETPESVRAALDEKIANIDPSRIYRTPHGAMTGTEMRKLLERCTEWNGVKLPPREVRL